MKYYLYSYFRKKPDQDGFIDLEQIEDLFSSKREMKILLVEELVHNRREYEAK